MKTYLVDGKFMVPINTGSSIWSEKKELYFQEGKVGEDQRSEEKFEKEKSDLCRKLIPKT